MAPRRRHHPRHPSGWFGRPATRVDPFGSPHARVQGGTNQMSTTTLIIIIVIVLVVLVALGLALMLGRNRKRERQREQAAGLRQEATAHVADHAKSEAAAREKAAEAERAKAQADRLEAEAAERQRV